MTLPSRRDLGLDGRLVNGDDSGAAEPDVVLQADLGVLDLTLVRVAADLPGQLAALREASGAKRVTLADQSARGVDDPAAAVGGVLGLDQVVTVADLGHTERLVRDQFVGTEAIVQLDDVHFIDRHACFFQSLLPSGL